MNEHDPLEQRLRRQPLRPVPSAWREEILARARAAADVNRPGVAAETVSEDEAALFAGWRLLWARVPLAWGSLAALWLVLVGVNLTLPSPVVGAATEPPASIRRANLAALNLLTAEADGALDPFAPIPEAAPARKPSDTPHGPRSERLRILHFGEATFDFPLFDIA